MGRLIQTVDNFPDPLTSSQDGAGALTKTTRAHHAHMPTTWCRTIYTTSRSVASFTNLSCFAKGIALTYSCIQSYQMPPTQCQLLEQQTYPDTRPNIHTRNCLQCKVKCLCNRYTLASGLKTPASCLQCNVKCLCNRHALQSDPNHTPACMHHQSVPARFCMPSASLPAVCPC